MWMSKLISKNRKWFRYVYEWEGGEKERERVCARIQNTSSTHADNETKKRNSAKNKCIHKNKGRMNKQKKKKKTQQTAEQRAKHIISTLATNRLSSSSSSTSLAASYSWSHEKQFSPYKFSTRTEILHGPFVQYVIRNVLQMTRSLVTSCIHSAYAYYICVWCLCVLYICMAPAETPETPETTQTHIDFVCMLINKKRAKQFAPFCLQQYHEW